MKMSGTGAHVFHISSRVRLHETFNEKSILPLSDRIKLGKSTTEWSRTSMTIGNLPSELRHSSSNLLVSNGRNPFKLEMCKYAIAYLLFRFGILIELRSR